MANPNTAAFPSAIATDSDLPPATNSFSTTLNANVNSSATTLTVLTTATLNVPCLLRITNEIILVAGKTPTTITGCTRGFGGSSASSHTIGEVVSAYIFDWHFNQLAVEVKALQSFLGVNGTNIIASGQSAAGGDLQGNFPAPDLLDISGVVGSYVNANIQVDGKGRVIVAASGPTSVGNILFSPARAEGAGAVLTMNYPAANSPTAQLYNSSDTMYAVAQFAQNDHLQDHFIVPAGYTGSITVEVHWRAAATTGAVNWTLALKGVAAGANPDNTFASSGSVLANSSGTTNRMVVTAITGFDASSLAAGVDCFFKISRGTSGDTMSGDAEVVSIRFVLG